LITDPGVPFAPVRKNNRESLEQLPNLILKLTEEVKELKTSNSELMENIRYKEGAASLEGLSAKLSTTPDIIPSLGRSDASSLRCFTTVSVGTSPILTMCSSFPQGSDSPYQSPNRKRWTQSRTATLLPESPVLWGLISQFVSITLSSSKENSSLAYYLF